ncbi:31882_t:CDS:10, partial [Gigaspora margarita]
MLSRTTGQPSAQNDIFINNLPINPIDSINPINPINSINQMNQINQINPNNSINSINSINLVSSISSNSNMDKSSNVPNLRHLKRFKRLDTINESSEDVPRFIGTTNAFGIRFNNNNHKFQNFQSSPVNKSIYFSLSSFDSINNSFATKESCNNGVNNKTTTVGNSVDKMSVIPRFYFPIISKIQENRLESALTKIQEILSSNNYLNRSHFGLITRECGLPRYMSAALFCKIVELGNGNEHITLDQFERIWKTLIKTSKDEASLCFNILRNDKNNFLTIDNFVIVLKDIIMNHPGLEFLRKNIIFRERYVETVICRLFYDYNRNWSGKMTYKEFKRMDLPGMLRKLESKVDLNNTCDYFSYRHFYVIYCKFWELDNDYDLRINKKDLARYSDNALTSRIIDRVIHGYGKMTDLSVKEYDSNNPKMRFLLSEVDKSTNTSIEYWFRCLDSDGDGVLSVYELEWFYEEQLNRMKLFGIEPIKFKDCICQMFDLIKPSNPYVITLKDLKRCKQNASPFFDMFFNLSKFIAYENYQQQLGEVNEIDAYINVEYEKILRAEQNRRRSHEKLEALGTANKNIPHKVTLDGFRSNVV